MKKIFFFFLLLWITYGRSEVIFKEDFSGKFSEKWRSIDVNFIPGKSSIWGVSENSYVYFPEEELNPSSFSYSFIENKNWQDYILTVKFKQDIDGLTGIVFKFKDLDNTYRLYSFDKLRVRWRWRCIVLDKISGGNWSILASKWELYREPKWENLRIVVSRDNIYVYLNGQLLFNIIDKNPLKEGTVGFFSIGNKHSYFDDIFIYSIDQPWIEYNYTSRVIPLGEKVPFEVKITNYSTNPLKGLSLKVEGKCKVKLPVSDKFEIKGKSEKNIKFEIEGKERGGGKISIYNGDKLIGSKKIYITTPEIASLIPIFGDFHMHTTYSDGKNTPLEMFIQCKKVGLDVISITDHGTILGSLAGKRLLNSSDAHMLVIIGEENGCDYPNTHILTYKIPENFIYKVKDYAPKEIRNDIVKVMKWAKSQGMVLIQAHPVSELHKGTPEEKLKTTTELLENQLIDGFEIITSGEAGENVFRKIKFTTDFYNKWKNKGILWPITASTDSHNMEHLGKAKTLLFVKSFTEEEVLSAIKNKKTVGIFNPEKDNIFLYGPDELVSIAEIYIEDFMPFHDELAKEEAYLLHLYFGGHTEKKKDIREFHKKWKQLLKEKLPFVNFENY